MTLGLESGVVRLVPYDSAWPQMFRDEAARIEKFLREHDVQLALEHMGSTAVPGLSAKPVLDILAARADTTPRDLAIGAIVAAGYVYRGESGIPGRDFFRRGDPRSYHIHLTTVDSTFWREHRAFRDYLREHAAAAAEYAQLKAALAQRFPNDRESYIEGKTEFVRCILAKAAESRLV